MSEMIAEDQSSEDHGTWDRQVWLKAIERKLAALLDARVRHLRAARDLRRRQQEAAEAYGIEPLRNTLNVLAEREDIITEDVRATAIDFYKTFGEKKVGEYMGIRIRRSLAPFDEAQAFDWCMAHLPAALQLNRDLLQKFAITMPPETRPGWLQVVETPAATISSALDEKAESYLHKAETPPAPATD